MNIAFLKTFITVCDCGNFTEASKLLYVPQPTVSNRIKYLEEELGHDLFIKKNKGKRTVELTSAGETFLPYAKHIIYSLDVVKYELNSSATDNFLKIGSTIPLTHPLLYEKINSLYISSDKINVKFLSIEHSNILRKIEDRALDMALVTEPINDDKIACILLDKEKIDLIVSSQHKFVVSKTYSDNFECLEGENLIQYETFPHKLNPNVYKVKYKKTFVTNQMEIIKHQIKNNRGITFLPTIIFQKEIEEGDVVNMPIGNEMGVGEISYYLIYHKNHLLSKGMSISDVNQFINDYVQKTVKEALI